MMLEMEGHFFHCYNFMTLARILGNNVKEYVLNLFSVLAEAGRSVDEGKRA
jgi:hypothetical protein